MRRKSKKVLLGASWSIIEPLGLFHLSSIAKQEGWQPKIVLAREPDFPELDKAIKEFKPDMLGFTAYIGNHHEISKFFEKIKKQDKDLITILGGPHATYSPQESLKYADYVVVSEGFDSFRRILREDVKPGVIHLRKLEHFPPTDREQFYKDNPKHRDSPVKNIVTHTGCPYSCTYCYNSSTLSSIENVLSPEQIKEMKKILEPSKKLFCDSSRTVDEVIAEALYIQKISPSTQMIFFQDDIFGKEIKWVREFAKKWDSNLAFHAQMRFEFGNPKNPTSKERLELLREAGGSGLTFAIESSNPIIRKEILNRHMKNDIMFETLDFANKLGYKVRTEQMLGLPLGATTEETKINLEADLETLELNVKLKEQTGLPTIAWASTLAPYKGTEIEKYCVKHGFYKENKDDIPMEGYRIRSVLNFPKKWVGPSLSSESNEWLSKEEEKDYKNKLYTLMNLFTTFASMPKGHKLAEAFLNQDDKSYFGLSTAVRYHLYDYALFGTKK